MSTRTYWKCKVVEADDFFHVVAYNNEERTFLKGSQTMRGEGENDKVEEILQAAAKSGRKVDIVVCPSICEGKAADEVFYSR